MFSLRPAMIRRSAVRKYALILVASAVLPMLVVGLLYDRYARGLLEEFTGERVNARLIATASRLESFLAARANQLTTLARHPAAASLRGGSARSSGDIVEIVQLEADHPDLYGILIFGESGHLQRAVGGQAASGPPYGAGPPLQLDRLPSAALGNASVLGPRPPADGRSGWFLMREAVESGGAIALHVRLASLTELMGAPSEADLLTPVLRTPGGDFDTIGRPMSPGRNLVLGPEILPGWRPCLLVQPDELLRPFAKARIALLFASVVAGGAIALLLLRMAWRLKERVDLLSQGTEVVASGKFNHRVEVSGDDEIALLGRRFNRMAARLERLVERTSKMRRAASLGQFATGVAHEVRNPLAAIKTTVQALARLERDPPRVALLSDMEREVGRMGRAMEAILTFGRPRAAERQVVPLDEEVRRLFALLHRDAEARQAALVMGEGLAVSVLVDPDHLRQVLLNLATNALQAVAPGGTVTVRARAEGHEVEIEVEDDGPGIPADKAGMIFEPFYTTKRGGTGLGLSISRQLAELNGGSVTIASAEGQGTKAILTLQHHQEEHADHPDH